MIEVIDDRIVFAFDDWNDEFLSDMLEDNGIQASADNVGALWDAIDLELLEERMLEAGYNYIEQCISDISEEV